MEKATQSRAAQRGPAANVLTWSRSTTLTEKQLTFLTPWQVQKWRQDSLLTFLFLPSSWIFRTKSFLPLVVLQLSGNKTKGILSVKVSEYFSFTPGVDAASVILQHNMALDAKWPRRLTLTCSQHVWSITSTFSPDWSQKQPGNSY